MVLSWKTVQLIDLCVMVMSEPEILCKSLQSLHKPRRWPCGSVLVSHAEGPGFDSRGRAMPKTYKMVFVDI